MLVWTIICFVLAVVAAFFSFWRVSGVDADTARTLFFVFGVLFVLSLVIDFFGRNRRRRPA